MQQPRNSDELETTSTIRDSNFTEAKLTREWIIDLMRTMLVFCGTAFGWMLAVSVRWRSASYGFAGVSNSAAL